MAYLTNSEDIRAAIAHYAQQKTLWIDTEVADYQTSKPRLSLIQVLEQSTDLAGETVGILDVLNQGDLVQDFIEKIMLNEAIGKVFHNARYDITFLGKRQAKNIICTRELAEKIPYYIVPVSDYKLKTLAEALCHFPCIDKSEQGGDWGIRPLSEEQLNYAKMDVVYLAQVHHRLLQLYQLKEPNPEQENLIVLSQRYQEILHNWKVLDSEISHLKERIKQAMNIQQKSKINGFELTRQKRINKEANLGELARKIYETNQRIDFPIKLTNDLQKALGEILEGLAIEEKQEQILTLRIKESDSEVEELPF
jgi:ribonuclease D